jgi:hypothetical protein
LSEHDFSFHLQLLPNPFYLPGRGSPSISPASASNVPEIAVDAQNPVTVWTYYDVVAFCYEDLLLTDGSIAFLEIDNRRTPGQTFAIHNAASGTSAAGSAKDRRKTHDY